VISRLSEQEQKDLSKVSRQTSFKVGGKTIREPVWALKTRDNMRTITFPKEELPSYRQGQEVAGVIRK